MSNFKELIFKDIEKFLNENKKFSKKDLLNVAKNSYDLHNKSSTKNLKKDKEPTEYQIFLKNKMQELKAIEDAKGEGEEKLKQKDIMSNAAKLWKEHKK
jgi:hypothetical protein